MESKFDFIDAELMRRRQAGQLRQLRTLAPGGGSIVCADGHQLVNFSSNDYLGLASHPLLQARAVEFAERYGTGARASRLISGSHPGFSGVEETLAKLKQTERALVLNSGFQTNISLLPALADRDSVILLDRLCHNSLVQGAILSRCRLRRYRHGDLDHLRELLAASADCSRRIIATESVFSMDGATGDIATLVELAREFDALLVVDEAHATGVLGERGMGLTCGKGVDLCVGTFGKALGSFGAYIACGEKLWEYLINCCSGFIYTTALPPAILGAVDAALELVPQMDAERRTLLDNAEYLRTALAAQGWDTGLAATQIVPIMVGAEDEALALNRHLEENGYLVAAIRPPTVEPGRARLRLALNALHQRSDLERLVELLGGWRDGRS
ncbi:MAG: 8-amino-7-oxononanoate synthase [Candidatus Latescibacterota bacterium]|nr:8-amino-7-oxononanoate synthase [Candidatus Latescibacterota bacterium]